MRNLLHAEQRLKQNHKKENLPALHQEQFLLGKELGLMLNQENIHSPIKKYRRNWCIFFVMHNMYIEKKMEQFNSGELKKIFRNISCIALIGLTASGRHAWQEEEEETRKYTSTVLILQEQLCISEHSKVIQDAILFILHYRTMWLFRATSSSTYIMSDVQSICIPSSVRDWCLEVKFWATDRQCSFCLWILWTKNHKDPVTIDLSVPSHAQYLHKARKRNQDAVYWVDINLAMKKGLKFYQTRSNAIILQETLPAYCIPKVVRMETGEVKNEKVYMSPRPPPKISLKHDWKRELGSEHARTNQFQIQVVTDRGNPSLKMTREPCKMEEKRPVPRRSMKILFTKKLFLRTDWATRCRNE